MIRAAHDGMAVEVLGLSKHFGSVCAVDGICFRFVSGEVHGFIGPNGAGKTTTMRIIATLEHPDEGDVLFNGVSAINYPDRIRPRVGFMPDYLDSYQDMMVEEYLDFYARAYGLKPARRRKRLGDVVDFTGLGELLDRPVNGLSKGMKQRLSLARVLVNDPDVLILDEPAAGLDPRARVELRSLVRLLADRGKAVFISSHILTELSAICDSVTIIEKGRVEVSDSVHDIQQRVDAGVRAEVRLVEAGEAERERLLRFLAETPGVTRSEPSQHGAYFSYEGDANYRAELLRRLVLAEFRVTDFLAATSDLEGAFLALTKGTVS
ncbi:MAG: ABC transporter ATP-binding protein [Planctomycetota bacterium]